MSLIDNIKCHSKKLDLPNKKRNELDIFLEKGFPTTKDEDWKYTSLKKIVSNDFSIDKGEGSFDEKDLKKHSLGLKNKIIFFNGQLVYSSQIVGLKIYGFTEFETKKNDSLSNLNSSLATKGYTITLGKNTIVKSPIEIIFFTNNTVPSFIQYRNRITIGDNSEIKIVEKIQNLKNVNCLTNHFTQINVGKNSSCEYNKIQNNNEASNLIDSLDVFQKSDSTCIVNTLVFGGYFTRNNINFEQNGSNAESNMNGVSVLNNNQFADNHTFVDHKIENCRSNEMYKGIYLDHSKGVFNGKIMVRPDAQKIDAFQSNNNLLLSDHSTVDTKPQLEIYADDVKCSHGCTVGQLDKNALFYMRSRGVSKRNAKAILTHAFAAETIEQITIPELKLLSQQLLSQKLNVDFES